MINTNTYFPAKRRVRRKRKANPSPAVAGLTLIAAEYLPDEMAVLLSFDREIDRSAIDVAAFVVNDPVDANARLGGTSPEAQEPNQVKIAMDIIGGSEGDTVTLTATAANGLTPLGGGAPWSGVAGLALPFGE